MRIYLDQMIHCDVAEELSNSGFDVLRAQEVGQARADDKKILDFAIKTERLLITLDEHFGDWIVLPLRRHPGVIRLKIHPTTTEKISALLIPFLKKIIIFPSEII